jgi:7-cyano-7-deazaguanine synthase
MLLIYSGGMDSTVLLYEYRAKIKSVVFFDYGSKHNHKEFGMVIQNARQDLGIPVTKINLGFIGEHFKSDLLNNGGEIPEGHFEDKSMIKTVVPFRNGIMLSIATGFAESKGYEWVAIANHSGDRAIYPDCRAGFIDSMNDAMVAGTYAGVRVFSPYVNIDKRAIALRGQRLGVDFSKTWTCYKGSDYHCGRCGSCTERKEALIGFDTTKYL